MTKLYMETTKIPADKTAGEIGTLLSYAGATKIMTEYENKQVTALTFGLLIGSREIPFTLPVRVEPVFKLINGRRRPSIRAQWVDADRDQAVRIAWRQLFRWVQAQLALIETGMVQNLEVFLPYTKMNSGKTFYQQITDDGLKLLPYHETRKRDEAR